MFPPFFVHVNLYQWRLRFSLYIMSIVTALLTKINELLILNNQPAFFKYLFYVICTEIIR